MDAQRLKQYRALQREIRQLERQIGKLQAAKLQPGRLVRDSVQASSKTHPYLQYRASVISWVDGDDPAERQEEIEELEDVLKESRQRCKRELWVLNRYIDSRRDSEDRQLLRMRYVEGLSQQEIAVEMHVDRTTITKMLKKWAK